MANLCCVIITPMSARYRSHAASVLAAAAQAQPAPKPAVRVYVTNEASGDLTVIDPATQSVIATAPLGKRPRGIKVSPVRKSLFVALSGSPPAPPGVDE